MIRFTRILLLVLNGLNWIGIVAFGLVLAALVGDVSHVVARLLPRIGGAQGLTTLELALGLSMLAGIAAHVIFRRLDAMLATLAMGDVFVAANARRLRQMASALLAINLLDLIYGIAAIRTSVATHHNFGWSFSVTGWLAALLLFVLAQVFAAGTRMRDDLEGTV